MSSNIFECKLILKSWSLQDRNCSSRLPSNPSVSVTAEILSFLKEGNFYYGLVPYQGLRLTHSLWCPIYHSNINICALFLCMGSLQCFAELLSTDTGSGVNPKSKMEIHISLVLWHPKTHPAQDLGQSNWMYWRSPWVVSTQSRHRHLQGLAQAHQHFPQ